MPAITAGCTLEEGASCTVDSACFSKSSNAAVKVVASFVAEAYSNRRRFSASSSRICLCS